jgi:hypothetical protein
VCIRKLPIFPSHNRMQADKITRCSNHHDSGPTDIDTPAWQHMDRYSSHPYKERSSTKKKSRSNWQKLSVFSLPHDSYFRLSHTMQGWDQKKAFDSRTDNPSFDKTHWKQTKCLCSTWVLKLSKVRVPKQSHGQWK